ncbi:unnamed protein product [Phytophthora fragariaefolia]|uniref:Unnamed protein product n=1 Tax=Phytophthora fragariaefolia TaxID=1490495 RepID=A0A9W6XKL4_9STRA|nr:unnamed protein product [Phytophthora fragariaefolia]
MKHYLCEVDTVARTAVEGAARDVSAVRETVKAAAQGPASSAPRSITHGQLDTIDLEEEAEEAPRPGSGKGPPAGQAAPGQGALPPPTSAPGGATPSAAHAVAPATREAFRGYRQERKMRLPTFKDLDGQTPISTWRRAVQTETRCQERSLGVHWDSNAVYYEMASHLEGEALRWYGNIMGTIIDETDDNLARLLRERYGEQRSDPEVVGSLNDRKQMRGEPLVEYAVVLRAIVADRSIGEEWLIVAFLNGMSNQDSATHVRGRESQTLDEAVRTATRQVGKFGEGHWVGLEEAITRQDARREADLRMAAAAPSVLGAPSRKRPAEATDINNTRAMGLGAQLPTQPPRYDVEGRLISLMSALGMGGGMAFAQQGYQIPQGFFPQQGFSVPQGYILIPLGASTGSQTADSKFQTGAGTNNADHNARLRTPGYEGGGNRRTGKINQVEAGHPARDT